MKQSFNLRRAFLFLIIFLSTTRFSFAEYTGGNLAGTDQISAGNTVTITSGSTPIISGTLYVYGKLIIQSGASFQVDGTVYLQQFGGSGAATIENYGNFWNRNLCDIYTIGYFKNYGNMLNSKTFQVFAGGIFHSFSGSFVINGQEAGIAASINVVGNFTLNGAILYNSRYEATGSAYTTYPRNINVFGSGVLSIVNSSTAYNGFEGYALISVTGAGQFNLNNSIVYNGIPGATRGYGKIHCNGGKTNEGILVDGTAPAILNYTSAVPGIAGGGGIAIDSGTLKMDTGEIRNGITSATYNGKIDVTGTFDFNGGTINNGYDGTATGNINLAGTFAQNIGTVNNGYSASATGNIVLSGSAAFNYNSGTLVNGLGATGNITVGGSSNFTQIPELRNGVGGTGTVSVSGGTYTQNNNFKNGDGASGVINVSSGTYSLSNLVLSNGFSTAGQINISGGLLSITGVLRNGVSATGTITVSGGELRETGGLYNGYSSTGVMNISGGTFNCNNLTANGQTGSGTINITGGTTNANSGAFYNGNNTAAGVIAVSSGLLDIKSGVIFINGTNSAGTINLSGGTITQSEEIRNGVGAAGVINESGGTYNQNANLKNGDGDTGTVNIYGGTHNVNSNYFYNGATTAGQVNLSSGLLDLKAGFNFLNGTSATGTLAVSGGELRLNGTFYNGYQAQGILNLSNGTVNQNGLLVNGDSSPGGLNVSGGTYNQAGEFQNGVSATGTVTSTGGTFNQGERFRNGHGASGIVNINGGTYNTATHNFYNGNLTTGQINISSGLFNTTTTMHNGGSGTGTINVSGGELRLGGETQNGNISQGTINLTNGTINQNNFMVNGDEATGIINISNGTYNQNATLENGQGATGTITETGGIFNQSNDLRNGSGASGIVNINGATHNINSNYLYNGYTTVGQVNVTSGLLDIKFAGAFSNGQGTTGTLNLSGGTISQAGFMNNGIGGTGTINETGGTYNQSYGIRNGIGSNGIVNISGGTHNVNADYFYNGHTTLGQLNVSSGLLDIKSGAFMLNGYSANAKTSLSGGLISLSGRIDNGNTLGGSGVFDLTGGTLNSLSGGVFNNLYGNGNPGILSVFSGGTYVNNVGATINNYNIFAVYAGGTFSNSGTLNNYANFFNFPSTTTYIINSTTYPPIIPPLGTLIIPATNIVIAYVDILNLSASSIDIYGKLYMYANLLNGNGSNPGTVNIYYPGRLYLISGGLINGNASSQVNTEQGGTLYNYFGTVDVDLGDLEVKAGGKYHNARGNQPNPSGLSFNNGCKFLDFEEINLDRDLDIDYTWTITGQRVINGYGKVLDLGTNGSIVLLGNNASLKFEDIILDNVSGNQIRCTDNNATFSFSNVVWIQDASFSLTWGKLDIVGNTKICGEGTSFNYQSNQVSTVRAGAMLEFDFVNFNYNTGTKNLLIMEDESSALHLDRTTLLATQPFEINRGTLFTTGNVTLNGNTLIDLQNLEHIYLHEAITQIGNVIF